MKPLSNVTDPAVVKALAHPLRVRILGILEHRTASPSELAGELGAPLGNVSYHVRQLERFGLIKLVKEAPRRGAVEHYFKLDMRPRVSDEGWSRAPSVVKEALSSAVISQIGEQVSAAAGAGGFEREDIRLSRLPLGLDDRGFKAAAAEVERLAEALRRIEEASQKRLARNGSEPQTNALAVLMLFEAGPSSSPLPTGKRKGSRGKGKRSRARTTAKDNG